MALMWACTARAWADESSLNLPNDFDTVTFGGINGVLMLKVGLAVCVLGGLFGLWQYTQVKNLPAHKSMLEISAVIYETCKTYLFQQGKFLAGLWVAIAICMTYYFLVLRSMPFGNVVIVLIMSIVGILGSCGVAWFGIRINTLANSRTAFSSLRGKPFPVYAIPLQSGMSIGMLLVCVELIMMLIIMLFLPRDVVGPSFIGFAIGESLGASVLRICGGIFTKIADIGSDLMKIVFNIKEDDARNPGVIADCTGDNAGDSVGPTADGFETYGVTGVALIVFIVLAFAPQYQSAMIIWIFVMRILMIVTSLVSFFINDFLAKGKYANADKMDFEGPLTVLVWLTSLISIAVTYGVSYFMLADFSGVPEGTWWKLASIISCGTLAAAVIPELTKVFTSASSAHVAEIVSSSREGGASLTILSGMVAGNFSAFWMGITIAILMGVAYMVSLLGLSPLMGEGFATYISVFAFGLVAFGFLGMGPVTIAVDSYGPVTDNAQSVYELSLIEQVPDVHNVIEKEFGFKPDFDHAKHFLEENDGAGNTFKATAKPVLIGTAVVGATTMIFSIILLLKKKFGIEADTSLNLVAPMNILGLACGGAVVSWFCGASMQAVTTGAYRAVEFIKANIKLDMETTKANVDDSRKVVQICTEFAQKGMINIFIVIFCLALSFAMLNPYFFVAYLMSIALFGLFNAIYMANAGGSWDNAKKVVEVELKEKGTPLHAATVVGDTVGDPYKDTSSVALNPIIKFTTLFGLLAVEIAVDMDQGVAHVLSLVFFLIALVFVWRSFYAMRIGSTSSSASASSASPEKEMAAATH
ncbi:MAG TPA: sodium-translocating pyrophosphatase [Candidatus Xenobia bacterium]|jgi:K(+)-stimulated pyrophosphate-energized sodium pump